MSTSLKLSTDGLVEAITLEKLYPPSNIVSQVLPRGERVINLKHRLIVPTNSIASSGFQIVEREQDGTIVTAGTFQTEQQSLDELLANGDFYIDYTTGEIHSFSPVSTTN